MLDVPSHLYQPLCVDTNICYDLDMSKFPGLNDPEQMYQPTLLITTHWSNYVHDDKTIDAVASDDVFEENLFELIESCNDMFLEVDSFGDVESEVLQSLLDDVVSSKEVDFIHTSSQLVQPLRSPLLTDDNKELPRKELFHLSSSCKGQKRSRCDESGNHLAKRSKMTDIVSPQLPSLVTVCPTSSRGVLHRDS